MANSLAASFCPYISLRSPELPNCRCCCDLRICRCCCCCPCPCCCCWYLRCRVKHDHIHTDKTRHPPTDAIMAIYVVVKILLSILLEGLVTGALYTILSLNTVPSLVKCILPRPVTGSQPIYRVRVCKKVRIMMGCTNRENRVWVHM